jgi:serine/threonine-protein kinase
MLTGVKPFRGKSITEIMSFMETRGPEDIRALNPAVPDSLKLVITKALAFDPARRFDDAVEFSNAIVEAFPARFDPTPLAEPPVSANPAVTAGVRATPPAGATWPPDLLREIERDLATFVGPMAAIALRRAIGQTNDVVALYDLLGRQVVNPRDRAEFLARGQRRAATELTSRPPSLPPAKPERKAVEKRDQPPPSPGLTNIASVETNLAHYIGPIAKILIKRELEKHETLSEFYRALAAHIPDERDRENFLRAQGGN